MERERNEGGMSWVEAYCEVRRQEYRPPPFPFLYSMHWLDYVCSTRTRTILLIPSHFKRKQFASLVARGRGGNEHREREVPK